jgi:hypothetical protein
MGIKGVFNFFSTSVASLENRANLAATLLVSWVIIFFTWLQHYPTLLDPDAFYHAKMAVFLSRGILVKSFVWLPLTTLAQHFADHHFLYHVALIPFVYFFDPLVGIKVSIVLFGALVVFVYYYSLRRLAVPGAFWFTLLAFTSPMFLGRLNYIKALPLSLIIYLLGLTKLREYRYAALGVLSAIYVWTYGGWPLLVETVIVYSAILFFLNSKLWRQSLKLTGAAVVGAVAGIVFNPYFPHNLWFYWQQIFKIALSPQTSYGVGAEWFSPSFWAIYVQNAALFIFIIMAASLYLLNRLTTKQSIFEDDSSKAFMATLFVQSFGLLVATMVASRYVEYFIPLSCLTLGLLASSLFKHPAILRGDIGSSSTSVSTEIVSQSMGSLLLGLGLVVVGIYSGCTLIFFIQSLTITLTVVMPPFGLLISS